MGIEIDTATPRSVCGMQGRFASVFMTHAMAVIFLMSDYEICGRRAGKRKTVPRGKPCKWYYGR